MKNDLDDWLHDAYEARPGVAERIARAALQDETPTKGRRILRPALGLLAALLVAAALWLERPTAPVLPAPTIKSNTVESHGVESHGVESHGVESHGIESHGVESPAPARLRITNDAGTVSVTTADGTRWIALQPATELGGPSS